MRRSFYALFIFSRYFMLAAFMPAATPLFRRAMRF